MEKKADLLQYIESEIIDFFPKVFVVNSFDPNIQECASKMFRFKSASGNKVSIWLFSSRLIIELPAKTSFIFSINIPDVVCMINDFLLEIHDIGKVYTRGVDNELIHKCIDLLQNELKSFKFEKDEGIIVYKNSLKLILKGNRKLNQLIDTLEMIKNKIVFCTPFFGQKVGLC
jgi:hypothetical protein